MRVSFLVITALFIFSNLLFAQVDLSKYYNAEVFNMSSTEYYQEEDLSQFKEVNPEDVEGFYDRGIEKLEKGLLKDAINDFDEVIALVPEYANAYYLRGVCYSEIDSLTMAEDDFNKAIEELPVFARAYTQLGLLYWRQDEIKKSKNYFDTAYELDETDLLPVFYKCNIALYHEHNLAKTKRLLNKVIKNDSTFSGAYFYKAAIKLAEGYNKTALKNFDKAIHFNSEFVGAYLWRGFTYLMTNRILEAEEDFSKLIELQPNDEDFWSLRSFLRIEKEDYKGAVKDMVQSTKLQDIDVDNFKGGRTSLSDKIDLKYALNYFASNEFHFSDELMNHLEEGLCLFLEEEYEEARHSFEIGQTIDSTEAAPFFFTALVYEYQKDFDSALNLYSQALLRDKDIYDAHKKRGMIYEGKNDFKRAYYDYSHLVRLKPDSKFGYKMKGGLKLKFQDYIGATLELTEAYKRDSSDLEIVFNRGLAREQIRQFQNAIDDFNTVLVKNKRDSEAIFHVAYCNFQLGDTLNASILCDSSLRISKYQSYTHNLKGQIRTAQGRYHEAIFSYNKAISMASNQIDYIYNRAMTYMKIKNWSEAINDLDKIVRQNPNIGEAFYQRALCYLEMKKREQGIADLKEAEKLGYEPAKKELSSIMTL